MIGLTRLTPFTPMFQLRREIDDVLGRFVGQTGGEGGSSPAWASWAPAVEGLVEDGNYVIRVALPGVDPKDIDVSVLQNELTIKGQRKQQNEGKRDNYFVRELSYGSFERSFTLPEGVDGSKVTAKCVNGILELRVPAPVAESPKKVQISIEGGNAQGATSHSVKAA